MIFHECFGIATEKIVLKDKIIVMPFKMITSGKNKGKYRSPSGKIWTRKAMLAYYARLKKKKK